MGNDVFTRSFAKKMEQTAICAFEALCAHNQIVMLIRCTTIPHSIYVDNVCKKITVFLCFFGFGCGRAMQMLRCSALAITNCMSKCASMRLILPQSKSVATNDAHFFSIARETNVYSRFGFYETCNYWQKDRCFFALSLA